MNIYNKIELRKVENGWVIKYYNAGEVERVFTEMDDVIKFIRERLK